MWATDDSYTYILMGFLPILYILYNIYKYGVRFISSLESLAIILMWIGYHLSPLVSLFTDELWDDYLLVPQYIDDGLFFSALCMMAFIVGFRIVYPERERKLLARKYNHVPNVKMSFLILSVLATIILLIIGVGGMEEFWMSKLDRGEGQFDERRGIYSKIKYSSYILSNIASALLAALAAIYVINNGLKFRYILTSFALLFVASLRFMFSFSRAAGAAFIVYSIILIQYMGKRAVVLVVICIYVAAVLGSTGYIGRGYYSPGVGNFLHALYNLNELDVQGGGKFLWSMRNPLDAMAPWTLKASLKTGHEDVMKMTLAFIYNLNPIPSVILPPQQIGLSLSEVMGTWGKLGLTTPVLAELYYIYGNYGALFWIMVGMVFGFVERHTNRNRSGINEVARILIFISIPIGLHQHTRPMSRLVYYSMIFIYLNYRIGKYRQRKLKFGNHE